MHSEGGGFMNGYSVGIVDETAARCLDRDALATALQDSRRRTLALLAAYERALGPNLTVPCSPDLNPPLWEAGHIGWFADWWIARNPERHRGTTADPVAPRAPARQAARGLDADACYNSSLVPHRSRWHLPLPDLATTRADLADSLQDTLDRLASSPNSDDALYFFRLALFHEDMHAEAAVYMAQALGLDPGEPGLQPATTRTRSPLSIGASVWTLGVQGPGFAFDNECQAHTVNVPAFEIDAAVRTWADVLPFIESGAYSERRYWSDAGWAWREAQQQAASRYLRNGPQGWTQQVFGRWQALAPEAPACHLNAYEAQAWCAWAGRGLPTEAQWEIAAQQPGFVWGQVWEWTASPFAPFPGFVPHPYRDYSLPWFDGRPVLKGASFATHLRMRHRRYRNYFTPERNDLFAGLRSVAL
jgi:gamma-glutamyl hercynylcysteine S-oxide synthase